MMKMHHSLRFINSSHRGSFIGFMKVCDFIYYKMVYFTIIHGSKEGGKNEKEGKNEKIPLQTKKRE